MDCNLSRAEIQGQMSAIRGNLDGEVGGIMLNARRLVDWKHYVRSFPWVSLAAAAAAGYLAVPHVSRAAAALPAPDRGSGREHRGTSAPVEAAVTGGMFGSLASLATSWALRAALQYAGQQFKNRMSAPRGDGSRPTVEP